MAEAKLNREYALRFLGVGLLMWGVAAWSVYDGTAAWPRANRRMEAARPDLLATNLTADAWLDTDGGPSPLDAVFAKQGAKPPSKLLKKINGLRLPKGIGVNRDELVGEYAKGLRDLFQEPLYTQHDLSGQAVQAAATFLLGLLAALCVAGKAGKRFRADAEGLHGNGFGGDIAYAAIDRVDWTQWDEKGIAVLHLAGGRRVKLDAWHFAGISGIVDEIRAHRPDLAELPRATES